MTQNAAYPEQGYLVLPIASALASGRYAADFAIYEGAITRDPLYLRSAEGEDFATEMAARTHIQAEATAWIESQRNK